MLENFIDKQLKKQGFIRVPISWTDDYKSLVEKNMASDKMLRIIGKEYNVLLEELANEKPITWLKEALQEIDVNTKGLNKEELIKLYVDTYAVEFDDDTEEEIK